MSTFAVIETGGKQYRVSAGSKVRVEKITADVGGSVLFDKVLLVADGKDVKIGTPYVSGASVTGTVLRQARGEKKIIFKYHSKTRYRKKKGHRQHFTEIEIASV